MAVVVGLLRAGALQAQLGMQVHGTVRDIEGRPCFGCRVTASGDNVISTPTDMQGRFVLLAVPAGKYRLRVAGPDGHVFFTADPDSPWSLNNVDVDVGEGINIVGVELLTPPPGMSETELLAYLSSPEVPPQPEPAPPPAGAPHTPDTSAPRPVFPCAPAAVRFYRGREAFVVTRGRDAYVADDEDIRCAGGDAYGCTRPSHDVLKRSGLAAGSPDCARDGKIHLPTVLFSTSMERHRSSWRFFNSEHPDVQGCAEIRKPDCGDYVSFNGNGIHECAHRTGSEATADESAAAYLRKITRIQEKIDADGACYQCCLKHLPQAIDAFQELLDDLPRQVNEGRGAEPYARAAECEYYRRFECGDSGVGRSR